MLECPLLGSPDADAVNTGKLPQPSEYVLRALAIVAPRSEYPRLSIQRGHQGPAVALVEIGPTGLPTAVSILQAPDDGIANALKHAISEWRFRTRGAPPRYCGKLTYYFGYQRRAAP
jgi:outer membrane biosynthesis protein TonB